MHKSDVVRAWKDPVYRASLSPEQLAQLPANPAGAIELNDEQLRVASGGTSTTAPTCTAWTFARLHACCSTA